MARQGVFSRNDDTPENIPRSLQLLSHRHGTVAKYMEIYPNFCEVLSPNESIKLNVTNFIRSIPLNTPQLSRVRLVQRFYAVPFRIMWQPWDDWIKGEDDSQFRYELPYPVNVLTGPQEVGADKPFGIAGRSGTSFSGGARAISLDSTTGYVTYNFSGTPQKFLINGIRELGDYLRYPVFSVLGYSSRHQAYLCGYQELKHRKSYAYKTYSDYLSEPEAP